MKKTIFAVMISASLLLTLAGCGTVAPAVEKEEPAAEAQVTADLPSAAEEDGQVVPAETDEPAAPVGRQDGERFEGVIMLEGMEETVRYEHVRNERAGFEMDYEYESLLRFSDADRERFVSLWDDPEDPENVLKVRYDTGNAELVASAISAALSGEYEIVQESCELANAGSCIRIDTTGAQGGGIASRLQTVYVIPAPDGCRVATAHYTIESAEGFGRRFSEMVNTLAVLERKAGELSDEQALSAIRNYCILSNPDLEGIANDGEYPVYWELASSDGQEVVVLFRSYTGAELRYYIDRATGETYVTEFVPGITPEETRTDESLNVWEHLNG